MEIKMNNLGKYLKQHREKAGVTQMELANFLGYTTTQTVHFVEKGISMPNIGKLLPWCQKIEADTGKVSKILVTTYTNKIKTVLNPRGNNGNNGRN
jgi:DNA-binding XRE family transcriptional regulator